MRREPALSLAGALRILGVHDNKILDRLNVALGGIILASGGATALATVGPAALAPLAVFGAVWGWVDQKNEAITLLQTLSKTVKGRLSHEPTRSRRQLVTAAHTTIVIASYYDELREQAGKDLWDRMALTAVEKERLANLQMPAVADLFEQLYRGDVPHPSAARGYSENLVNAEEWISRLAAHTSAFLSGLAMWPPGESLPTEVVPRALDRYQDYYFRLASAAPEMHLIAHLDEHAATRTEVRSRTNAIARTLDRQTAGLERVETLLTIVAGATSSHGTAHQSVSLSNSGRLSQPVLTRAEAADHGHLKFPTVQDAFIAPDYKVAWATSNSRIADEHWWSAKTAHEHLDLWLAAYFCSIEATQKPLLLLGHPGAGKSMLMKVLAARLPASDYTCVLVPLRAVSGNAPITQQIDQALSEATNGRARWFDLAEEQSDTIQVIILDGLDELLQASRADRSAYLHEVAEFQRIEAEQGRPTATVVTSRTVVADRVDIPLSTSVIKLEDFRDVHIAQWLDSWNRENSNEIEAGRVRPFQLGMALGQRPLARQPLLLLMLALYSSDPTVPQLNADLTATALYSTLFRTFARREAVKAPAVISDKEIESSITQQLDRLSIAALGMFNRGRQAISEQELTADLAALSFESLQRDPADEDQGSELGDKGQRVLGEFFFVHSAETVLRGSGDESVSSTRSTRRSYEFMHATFSEYLVAYRIVEELREVADQAFGGRRRRDPDDFLLFALLSHQALAVRYSTLAFLAGLLADLPQRELEQIRELTEQLLAEYRGRSDFSGQYFGYQPVPLDRVRQIGAYSANLLSIRLHLPIESRRLFLTSLTGSVRDGFDPWRALVDLWRSAFDADSWLTLAGSLEVDQAEQAVSWSSGADLVERVQTNGDYIRARLVCDFENRRRLRYGFALHDMTLIEDEGDAPSLLLARLYADLCDRHSSGSGSLLIAPVDDVDDRSKIYGAATRLLLTRQAADKQAHDLLTLSSEVSRGEFHEIDSAMLLANICRFPALLELLPPGTGDAIVRESRNRPELALLARATRPVISRTEPRAGVTDRNPSQAALQAKDALVSELVGAVVDTNPEVAFVEEAVLGLIHKLAISLRDDRWRDDDTGPDVSRRRERNSRRRAPRRGSG